MFIFAFNNSKNRLNMGRLVMSMVLSAFYLLANAGNTNPYFYKVTAKSGDAVSILLSRYELASQNCNVEKFYELNDMKKGSKLFAAKEYYLPIKIFRYNGKSIRSTLNIDDVNEALDIQAYNEKLLKKGLRKESFKSSRKLWVPYHKLECNDTKSTGKTSLKKENTSSDKKSVNKINEKYEPTSEKTITVREDFATGKGGSTRNENKAGEGKEKASASKRSFGSIAVHDLFGEKYRNVNMFDEQLKGQVFYISSGHGGPDPGAQCTDLAHTLCEDEYAYDVALRLARDLTQHGATVHMIIQDENDGIRDDAFLDCDWDETCNGKDLPLRQLDRLKQRADQINKLHKKYKKEGVKKQTAIMIHVDSRNKEQRQDVFFYHYGNDKDARELAYNLQSTFEEKYEIFQKGRGYKGYVDNRGLYMLRKVNPTAVYVELANIRNKSDHIRLMESANRQALANWMFEGLTGIK